MDKRLETIGSSRAKSIVREQLAMSDEDRDYSSILAELVRTAIWTHQPPNTQVLTPVHRHRIVATASASAAFLLAMEDEEARDVLSRTIDELVVIGELDRSGNGYMLPTPVRWITVHGRTQKLLIGGVPTWALPAAIRNTIQYRHHVREGNGGSGLPAQSLDAWLNRPPEALDIWLNGIVEQESEKASPITAIELARGEWQRYPSLTHDFQSNRWKSVGENETMPSSVFLARARNAFSISSWGLLWVDGNIRRLAEIRPSDIDVRRIMYALDQQQGWPTKASIRRGTDADVLTLRNELPKSEQRFLTAIAEKVRNVDGKYYPRQWRLPKGHERDVRDMLERISVTPWFER